MPQRFSALVATVFVVATGQLGAQQEADVDLASSSNITRSVAPGIYRVILLNKVPEAKYTFTALLETSRIGPLNLEQGGGAKDRTCPSVEVARGALTAATSEQQVDQAVRGLAARVAGNTLCSPKADALIASTTEVIGVYAIGPGQHLTVTVERQDSNATKPKATWTSVFTAGDLGEWHTSFGYVLAIDPGLRGSSPISRNNAFYAKRVGDSVSVVARQASRKWISGVPSIMFSFSPHQTMSDPWHWGFIAGIGTDLASSAQVFAGGAWTFWQSVSLSVGLAAVKESAGLGKYRLGDTLSTSAKTTFDPTQLNEDVLRIRLFVGLSFRLDKNPFSSSTDATKVAIPSKAPTPPPAPKDCSAHVEL